MKELTPTIDPVTAHNAIAGLIELYTRVIQVHEHRLHEMKLANLSLAQQLATLTAERDALKGSK